MDVNKTNYRSQTVDRFVLTDTNARSKGETAYLIA